MPDFDDISLYRDIPGFPEYKASSIGEIWTLKHVDPRLIKAQRSGGYLTVKLISESGEPRHIGIHRAVLLAFAGAPGLPGLVTRHMDGNPLNNNSSNLAWGTPSQNWEDAVRHGRCHSGERAPAAKRTLAEIENVRDLFFRQNKKQIEIAEISGIHASTVNAILLGKLWKESANGRIKVPSTSPPSAKITVEKADEIRSMIDAGELPLSEIAKMKGVSVSIASQIGKRKIWSDEKAAVIGRYRGRTEPKRSGDLAPNCKMPRGAAIRILRMSLVDGLGFPEISKSTGASYSSVRRICRGESWPGLINHIS